MNWGLKWLSWVVRLAAGERLAMPRVLWSGGAGYALAYPSLAIGAQSERMVEAFNWTVVFLMAMPYVIVAGAAGWIGYHYTRAHRKRPPHERKPGLQLVKKGDSRG